MSEPLDQTISSCPDTEPDRRRTTPASISSRLQLGRYTGLGLWAIVIVIFGLWTPSTFLTHETLNSIITNQSITALLALVILFPFVAGQFDLSCAQNVGTSAILVGALMTHSPHFSPAAAIVATLAFGALVGAANGYFVSVVGVGSFIVTLAMSSLLLALAEWITNSQYVGPFPESFTNLATGSWLGVPKLFWYVIVVALVAWWVIEHTPLGRRMQSVGENPEAARLAGVRTQRLVFGSFVVSGVGASLCGILLASFVNTVDSTIGPAYLLPAFAAVFLGSTQLKPGRFNVLGTLIAIYLLGTGIQGLQLVGGSVWATDLFDGAALLGAVSVAVVSERRRGRAKTSRKRGWRLRKPTRTQGAS